MGIILRNDHSRSSDGRDDESDERRQKTEDIRQKFKNRQICKPLEIETHFVLVPRVAFDVLPIIARERGLSRSLWCRIHSTNQRLVTGSPPLILGSWPTDIIQRLVAHENPPFRPCVGQEDNKNELVRLMVDCWHDDPEERPHMYRIVERLKKESGRWSKQTKK